MGKCPPCGPHRGLLAHARLLQTARCCLRFSLIATLSPFAARSAAGAPISIPNGRCLECHSDKDLTMEKDGREVPIFTDESILKHSVHRETLCTGCHHDLTDSHPDDGKVANPVDCSSCHQKASQTYQSSVHGAAFRRGSESAPTCKDCHGGHDSPPPQSPDSPLHFTKQAQTCGQCHEAEASDMAESIHGKAAAKGIHESPTCTDCHEEHSIHSFTGSARTIGDTCSRCHESERMNTKFGLPSDRVKTFFESYHGLAIKGGATNAANCASCHGYHKILPSNDPASSIHRRNLVKTCGKCHPGAGENFSLGKVHQNDSGKGDIGARLNHWVRIGYIALIIMVVGGMILHNGLSWLRALRIHYHSRGETVTRMNLHQRIQHFVLLTSFTLLALSGFALKYPDSWLAWLFGDDELVRRWLHRMAGLVMLAGGFWHIVYLCVTREGKELARDMRLRTRDLADVAANLLYFVGKRPSKPQFGRFGYPEKVEYWAVIWGTVIMGATGLMIWFKIDVTRIWPRWAVDLAITIHYYEAILACLAIVVWHFYHVLFAPGIYPMNFAWWDGKVSKEWHQEEHPLDRKNDEPPPG